MEQRATHGKHTFVEPAGPGRRASAFQEYSPFLSGRATMQLRHRIAGAATILPCIVTAYESLVKLHKLGQEGALSQLQETRVVTENNIWQGKPHDHRRMLAFSAQHPKRRNISVRNQINRQKLINSEKRNIFI